MAGVRWMSDEWWESEEIPIEVKQHWIAIMQGFDSWDSMVEYMNRPFPFGPRPSAEQPSA